MKRTTLAILAALAILPVAGALRAADDPNKLSIMGGTGVLKDEITPEVKAAVKKGLDWLAKTQNTAEGSFTGRSGGYGDGTMPGIVALAGIAFLADGNMPDEGPHGKVVAKALEYVLKNTQDSGLIAGGQMYGHGFATLFLAECYGQAQANQFNDADKLPLKEKLQKAVRLIVQSQNVQGGWRYNPTPQDADISVTICQVMALRAARNAGITVPSSVVDKAIDYVKKSQEHDGGFAYMLNSRGSEYPRSAAGVACLYYLGEYGSKEREAGIKYLMNQLPDSGNGRGGDSHFYYGNYYATQAMFMAGGNSWEKYWPAIRKALLSRQAANGSWTGDAGDVYATSMALIMLQVPNRLLPILQK